LNGCNFPRLYFYKIDFLKIYQEWALPIMLGKLLQPEIAEYIKDKKFHLLREGIDSFHPHDLAELISEITQNDKAIVFRLLPKNLAADTFEYLTFDIQQELLKALAQEEVATILNEMSPDDRTALLEELPASATKQLLNLLSSQERHIAINLLGYPEGSIGRLMTPDYLAVKPQWTVKEVLEYIRKYGKDSESLNVVYVISDNGKLLDDLRIREFLLSPLDKKVSDLMDERFIFLQARENSEKAVELFRKYDRVALPVVDENLFMIGIVTIDDILDVLEESHTEDIQKFGGLEALKDSYISTPLWQMIKRRAGWLVFLFLGELFTATAMAYFEQEIAKAVVLALFVPLIISSGGNSGSQAATLIIRALALKEIDLFDWYRIIKREIISGLILGSILGLIGFFRIVFWSMFSNIYGPHWLLLALTVAFSLVGVVLWGTLTGSMLPLLMKRLNFDPASSSAPFVATLVDVSGLVIYFSMAALILSGTLL
jgi:magnesium transporter